MNLDLVKEKIEAFNASFQPHKMAADGSDARDYYCADVVGNRRFAQNHGGYPRSDIAEINAAADNAQKLALIEQLTDYTPDNSPTAGMTDQEIALGHRSKYCQMPSEQFPDQSFQQLENFQEYNQ